MATIAGRARFGGLLVAAMLALTFPIAAHAYIRQGPATAAPRVEHRDAVRYVAIQTAVSMKELPAAEPALWKEVFGWLARERVPPAGPPLVRYLIVDMPRRIEIEVGVPVAKDVKGNRRIRPGVLPAGRYVVLTHVGPYDRMVQANADLQAWAKERDIQWQVRETKLGSAWAGRAEFYLKDPVTEKDPQKYETEIVYLAAGD